MYGPHRYSEFKGETGREFDDGRERLKTTGDDEAFVLPYSTPGKGEDQGRNLRAGSTRLSLIDDLGV